MDNFAAADAKFVDNSLSGRGNRRIWFVLPEGAGGNRSRYDERSSDRITGLPPSRPQGWDGWLGRRDRKVTQVVPRPLGRWPACRLRLGGTDADTVSSGTFVSAGRRPLAWLSSPPMAISAGLLLFRRRDGAIELLLAHPGGPLWARKDAGSWSLPKGEADDGESSPDALLAVARREFREELGHEPPAGAPMPLGQVRLRSGKIVHAWAVEGDLDPSSAVFGTFEMEWPPRSGRRATFPEVDRVAWCSPADARILLNPAQAAFVDRLLAALEH